MKFTYVCDAGTLGAFCRCWATTLGLLAFTLGVFTADAEETGSLRVAMSGQYMPLHGEQDGKKVGFEVDVAHLLGKHIGKQVVFVSRSDLGMGTLQAVAEGRADIGLSAITPTADRRKIVDFSRPICALRYLVVHDGSSNPCEKEVLAAQGPAYEAANKALGNVAKPSQDDMAAIQMIQEGKARCAIVEEPSIAKHLPNPGNLKVLNTPVGESPIAIAVPKGKKREIDALLVKLPVLEAMEEFQRKWKVQRTDAEEAWILSYAKWPAEIKAAWMAPPDFGMRYYRELREAYNADRLRQKVQDLTKGAGQAKTAAVVDSLIKLADEKPIVLEALVNLKLASSTSLEGKKHLVSILYDFLLSAEKRTTFGPDSSDLSAIATSIMEAGATSYVDLYQLSKSLCRRGNENFRNYLNKVYNLSLHRLLAAVIMHSQIETVRRVLFDFYQSCEGNCSEPLTEEGDLDVPSFDPFSYAFIKVDDRLTEELLRKLLQDMADSLEVTNRQSMLSCVERITQFHPRLRPMIDKAKQKN